MCDESLFTEVRRISTTEAAHWECGRVFFLEAYCCVSGGASDHAKCRSQHVEPDAFVVVGGDCGAEGAHRVH